MKQKELQSLFDQIKDYARSTPVKEGPDVVKLYVNAQFIADEHYAAIGPQHAKILYEIREFLEDTLPELIEYVQERTREEGSI